MVKEQNLRLTFKSRSLFQETVKHYETKMQRRVKHWIYKEMLNMTARSCLEELCFSFSRKYVTWREDQAADSVEKLSLSRREEKSQGRVRWSLLSCLVCMQCFGEKKKSSSSSELFSQSFRSSQLFSTLATVSFVGLLRSSSSLTQWGGFFRRKTTTSKLCSRRTIDKREKKLQLLLLFL